MFPYIKRMEIQNLDVLCSLFIINLLVLACPGLDVLMQNILIVYMTLVDVPHPQLRGKVVPAIVLKHSIKTSSKEIILFLKDKIAKFKIVKVIKFYPSLPLTPTDKVIKYRLKNDLINYRG